MIQWEWSSEVVQTSSVMWIEASSGAFRKIRLTSFGVWFQNEHNYLQVHLRGEAVFLGNLSEDRQHVKQQLQLTGWFSFTASGLLSKRPKSFWDSKRDRVEKSENRKNQGSLQWVLKAEWAGVGLLLNQLPICWFLISKALLVVLVPADVQYFTFSKIIHLC